MQSMAVHTRAFLKKAYCARPNRSIARGSVRSKGLRLAPDLQERSHDIFCQIYANRSVLPHHFHIPSLHFLFVALLRELNGEA